jgi:hypothetical protein
MGNGHSTKKNSLGGRGGIYDIDLFSICSKWFVVVLYKKNWVKILMIEWHNVQFVGFCTIFPWLPNEHNEILAKVKK